jgi:hypothetical protein
MRLRDLCSFQPGHGRKAMRLLFVVWISAALMLPQLSAASDKKTPPVRFTPEEVEGRLKYEGKLKKKPKITFQDFEAKMGHQKDYTDEQVQSYLAAYQGEVPGGTQADVKKSGYQGPKTFPWLRLRRSYKDILTAEDPSQGEAGAKKFDDLQGALFSYARDLNTDVDTWSAEMAVLAPFSWATGFAPVPGDGLQLARYGLVPSFSWNRITTSGDPKKEIDTQIYRGGVFGKWESGYEQLNALTLRGFVSYANDNIHDASVRALEFEIEPFSDLAQRLRVGYRVILWAAKDDPEHQHDTAILAYQFRAVLHGEYGERRREGSDFTGTEYDFFRLGPQLQFDLEPLFISNLSLGLRYKYMLSLSGQNPHDSLFNADLEWALLKDPENQRRLTLKFSYVNGGLDLTQARAHTLLIGLGAAF